MGQRKRRWYVPAGFGAAVLAVVGVALARQSDGDVPTIAVKQTDWTDWLEVRGEVKALRSLTLTAPVRAGQELQVLKIVSSGTVVKPGDVVMEFDAVKRTRTLDEQKAALRQADAEVERTRAEARLKEEEGQTKVLKGAYDLERARLEATKGEVISAIEGEKKKLDEGDKEDALHSVHGQVRADKASWSAQIESFVQKRRTANFEVKESESVISAMTVKAPVEGTVTILPNGRARTGGWGGSAPDFKVGDRVWPGAQIAELPDLSSVRIIARVDESDRGKLAAGQEARVKIDALPDKEFTGKLAEISPLAKIDFSSGWPPQKNFDLLFELKESDPRLRSGLGGITRVAVGTTKNALVVPSKACFNKGGRTVAYIRRYWSFEEREVEVARRSKTEAVIARGLAAGDKVALVDPTLPADERQP
jgi:HlyD family secretion protein